MADPRRDHCIDGLILGGRERPRILHAGDAPGVLFRDTTRIRAHSSVREVLRSRRMP